MSVSDMRERIKDPLRSANTKKRLLGVGVRDENHGERQLNSKKHVSLRIHQETHGWDRKGHPSPWEKKPDGEPKAVDAQLCKRSL